MMRLQYSLVESKTKKNQNYSQFNNKNNNIIDFIHLKLDFQTLKYIQK